jgi:glutamyl-Q tRNA(Asp) synthetase
VEITRFAPSPNGPLHLGHAYAAIVAHDLAHERGGRMLLRIEDIDGERSRPELAGEFRAELGWLGLQWDEVAPQSARLRSYDDAATRLRAQGLLYPCTCTRAELDGPVYPGNCRGRTDDPNGAAWRLDIAKALSFTGPLTWRDALAGLQQAQPQFAGDPVLVRKDAPASYHLAATVDDAADGVTLVTRGADLFEATHVHRLLQALLGLPEPRWHHHPLLVEADGRKLAKRRGSPALRDRRLAGEDGAAIAADLRAGRFPAGISLGPSLD